MLTYAEVQALVETRVAASTTFPGTQCACFTGTKVQILTQKALLGVVNTIAFAIMSSVLCLLYMTLYWYRSTNTDAQGAARHGEHDYCYYNVQRSDNTAPQDARHCHGTPGMLTYADVC
jgi:hypothetical protein